MASEATVQRWRQRFVPDGGGALESVVVQDDPMERIARAKEAMTRLITDRFGGDSALLKAVDQLAISSEEAVTILAGAAAEPTDDHLGALEAIVVFDGTRPSFLTKENGIDFTSSYNTGTWEGDLQGYRDRLNSQIACVGRVESGESHIGTAFLVTPTLAITNRHVAQAIASFGGNNMQIKPNVHLDFGREEWDGGKSFDRRQVEAMLFAGKEPIVKPINHKKLDLAVIRVNPSKLSGDQAKRHLSIADMTAADFGSSGMVAAVGYPADPEHYVPAKLKSQYAGVLDRLFEGDGGAKRFAPGKPMTAVDTTGFADWTITHDASTINGNSGSPLAVLQDVSNAQPVIAVGLHYGGLWDGERTNWAHLLGMTGTSVGYGTTKTFADFCKAEGITL